MNVPAPAHRPRVLVTGADGFIGRHLQRTLLDRGLECRGAVRKAGGEASAACVVGDIGPATDWSAALDGIDMVVHLAARAHVLRESAADPSAEFMRVNAEGTAALVRAAMAAGISRFLYVSSIGVLGSQSGAKAFDAASPPRPHSDYTRSKYAGELEVRALAERSDVVVLRPPLVYGPGARANFLRLLQWVDKGWPLPLGAVHNRRSLLNVWNLCEFVVAVLLQPAPVGGTWLLSDGEDVATPELIRRIGSAMGRPVRLLPVPVSLLQALARISGHGAQVTQLCGSLALDMSRTRSAWGWSPPVSLDEGLKRTVEWYLGSGSARVRP